MAASIADTWSTNLEQVEPILQRYYDQTTSLASQLKPSKTVAASRYLYRIVFMKWIGGVFAKYSANRGDMGAGNGSSTASMQAGYFDSAYSFEVTKEQRDYAESNGSAMLDVMEDLLANSMKQLAVYDNVFLFGDGSGKLTNAASSSPAATQLIFAATTDTIGINRIFEGMSVDIWDATGATKRANGPYQITAIDQGTKTVTFGAAPTALAGTDLLSVFNVDVYGPTTLVTASSTWPSGGTTTAAGLTGDSWRHGLAYANNATGANYYLGKLKSANPQLTPVQVAAGGSAITDSTMELAKNLLIQKRDENVLMGGMCVCHMAQRAQRQDTVVATSVFYRNSTTVQIPDLQPVVGQEFMIANMPCFVDKRAQKDRFDYFNAKNWFRVEGHPSKFFDYGEGQKIAAVRGTTGNVLAAYEFKVVQKMDTGCLDPGASFYIDGLAVNSSY